MGFMESRKKQLEAVADEKRKGMFPPNRPQETQTTGFNEELLETLAEVEHAKWIVWARDIMEREQLSEETRARWIRFMIPYRELPEEIKIYSQRNAEKSLACFGEFLKKVLKIS